MADSTTPPDEPGTPGALAMRRGGVGRWVWLAAGLALAATAAWWMTHPAPLPTGQPGVEASTPLTVPIYIGVLGPSVDGGTRTLHLSDVTVPIAENPGSATAEAYICRGGSMGQTSDPDVFCPRLEGAKGSTLTLGAGDQLVIAVKSYTAGAVRIDPLLLTYRDGLQFATQPAGPSITVNVLER
jgi:hypothetical protein